MRTPSVSVIIPVHNRARYVVDAIDSILAQTWRDFELIVVDDGSTDDTPAVLARLDDPRLRVIRNEVNRGIPVTRNVGLTAARGEFVAWLDSDDRAVPRRLEHEVAYLRRHPDIDLVGSWTRAIDPAGRPGWRIKVLPTRPDEVAAHLLFRVSMLQYSLMGRAQVLKAHAYDESFSVSQDYDLLERLTRRHRVANLPRILVLRRQHDGRVTRTRRVEIAAMNQRVIERQLAQLGIAYTDADVVRHFRLPRLKKPEYAADENFMEWAESWLATLLEHNQGQRRYEPAALARVTGRLWAACCWRAPGGSRRLLAAPLRRAVATGVASLAADLSVRRLVA
jgi:glycosyltransferase involved in cell wall biosynthesis